MNSKKDILKSTSIIGASSIVSILINIIRAKAIAVILGPTGTGLIGAFQSAMTLLQNVASLGLNNSAVREIAQANKNGDTKSVSTAIVTLRRTVLLTGLLGFISTIVLAEPISQFTFDSKEYVFEIRLLSIAVFFNLIKGGQGALIQGMRRIKDLAMMSIISTIIGTAASIPILYFFNFDGITYFLIVLTIGQYVVSFYYARKIKFKRYYLSWRNTYEESREMIKLGLSFMGGGLVTALAAFLIRAIIIRDLGIADAGIYQAATAISVLYIGIVLQAMGKDFYPRLASEAFDSPKEIQLINEQIQVGMILAAPGLMFTLAFAPIAIKLFYSGEFMAAYPILQWMILGVFLQTISWPMGYLFVARAKGKKFLGIQILSQSILLSATYIGLHFYGLEGTGIAFFVLYILHVGYLFLFLKIENGFFWTSSVSKSIISMVGIFSLAFIIIHNFNNLWSGILVSCLAIFLSFRALKEIMKIMELGSFKSLFKYIKDKRL